jgi:hypothetical protein
LAQEIVAPRSGGALPPFPTPAELAIPPPIPRIKGFVAA